MLNLSLFCPPLPPMNRFGNANLSFQGMSLWRGELLGTNYCGEAAPFVVKRTDIGPGAKEVSSRTRRICDNNWWKDKS
jgi:hypothetical protein